MTPTIRLAQSLFVVYIGVFGLLTAFGNITDYGSNFAFVQHVMSMDTRLPGTSEPPLPARCAPPRRLHVRSEALLSGDDGLRRGRFYLTKCGLTRLDRSYPLQERAKRPGAWDFCGKHSELLACK